MGISSLKLNQTSTPQMVRKWFLQMLAILFMIMVGWEHAYDIEIFNKKFSKVMFLYIIVFTGLAYGLLTNGASY